GMAEVRAGIARGAHGFTRRVAIKRLLPEASGDATLLRMFFDEARTASRLHHAGIVSVLDYGEVAGAPFQVLELVEGRDAGALVRQALARGERMPIEVALHVVKEVAYALAFAHEAKDERGELLGIVHRDVKPSNILIAWSGDVKLGDFGIALARERCAKTTGLVTRGTPGYMSPEQLMGVTADATTDVFALGCTLQGLLVGRSPLTGDAEVAAMLRGQELSASAELPEDVSAIVQRAVRRRPEERYPTARAMAEALGQALAARLQTDATTRLLAWLRPLATAQNTDPGPAIEILSTVGPTERGNRHFTTTAVDPAALQATATGRAPHGHEVPPPASTAAMPPAHAAPLPMHFGVAPQRAASGGRGAWVFVVTLGATLLLAVVAVGGVLGGRWMSESRSTAAASVAPAPIGSAALTAAAAGTSSSAPTEGAKATAAARGGATASRVDPAPVKDGCRCDAVQAPQQGLCHPAAVTAPSCRCDLAVAQPMCWKPFTTTTPAEAMTKSCPERVRQLAVTARNGDPCSAFPMHARAVAGGFQNFTDPERSGRLDACSRCGGGPSYPRTPGAACVGIRSESGERADGVISCK
ncbi:MAG TPA: serine/threonine-protein kinase, partial [Labilithrix sp.]|nr:serine/threonine-protein kinase [Labilithrix sp.]